jgi:cysteine desulfurase
MKNGIINPEDLKELITSKTILVSVMHANNEIGTIQPLEEIGKITKEKGICFHSDACQSFGKIPLDVNEMNLDLLTINSHKIYGPKGVGALYIRKGTRIEPLLHGGGQEQGLRSSTENIAGIVGFAAASKLCMHELPGEGYRLAAMREKLVTTLQEEVEEIYFNGDPFLRLPGIINFCISGLEGESIRLLLMLDETGVSVSTGSACYNNSGDSSSHVLHAIGLNPFESRGSIRISLGRFNTEEEISSFLEIFLTKIKKLNPIFS